MIPVTRQTKVYLGDSVYLEFGPDGTAILTTENGYGPSNTVIMENGVLQAFVQFLQQNGWV
jgi:hypothetical protein